MKYSLIDAFSQQHFVLFGDSVVDLQSKLLFGYAFVCENPIFHRIYTAINDELCRVNLALEKRMSEFFNACLVHSVEGVLKHVLVV